MWSRAFSCIALLVLSVSARAEGLNPELAARLFFSRTPEGLEILSMSLREAFYAGGVHDRDVRALFDRFAASSGPESKAAIELARARVEALTRDPEIRALERQVESAATAAERAVVAAKLEARVQAFAREQAAAAAASAAAKTYSATRARFLGVPEPAGRAAHEAITADLFNGEIVEGRMANINDNKHSLYIVKVYNHSTGRFRDAYFKPRVPGDEDGWSRTPMEYVAYSMNRKLGMDYVPPVAYRYGVTINGQHFHEGALIFSVPETRVLTDVPAAEWGDSRLGVLSDSRILNVLTGNPDGHYKNLLMGRHWVDGSMKPAFIDFGAGLRPGADLTMTHYPAYRNSEAMFWVRERTLNALKALTAADFGDVRGFLADHEIARILHTRDGIVAYFERLRATYGDAAVLIR